MTTLHPPSPQIATLVEQLAADYAPDASHQDVLVCVNGAWDAVRLFSASGDDGIASIAARIAERDLRLRLGIDREAARLDPESRAGS
jgi:hypothetical protein